MKNRTGVALAILFAINMMNFFVIFVNLIYHSLQQ